MLNSDNRFQQQIRTIVHCQSQRCGLFSIDISLAGDFQNGISKNQYNMWPRLPKETPDHKILLNGKSGPDPGSSGDVVNTRRTRRTIGM